MWSLYPGLFIYKTYIWRLKLFPPIIVFLISEFVINNLCDLQLYGGMTIRYNKMRYNLIRYNTRRYDIIQYKHTYFRWLESTNRHNNSQFIQLSSLLLLLLSLLSLLLPLLFIITISNNNAHARANTLRTYLFIYKSSRVPATCVQYLYRVLMCSTEVILL